MKMYTTPIQQNQHFETEARQGHIPAMAVSTREILAVLSAIITATCVFLLSVWVAGADNSYMFAAFTWGLGFAFLALAIDKRGQTAVLQFVTGIGLLGLSWLQSIVSPDFAIVSGIIVATWVVVLILRKLR